MARRRVIYPVDTSDWLANMVLGFLVVAVIALFGLIALIDSENDEITAQEAATEVPSVAGGTATVVPSPTSVPNVDDEPGADAAGGGAVDQIPDEPVTGRTTDSDAGALASEPVTPLRPRGQPSDSAETAVSEPPPARDEPVPGANEPAPEEPAPGEPIPGEDSPAEPLSEEPVPEQPAPEEPAPGEPVSPDLDEPPGPSSPLDDPDRVPALVVSDAPLDVHTVLANLDGDTVPERVWAALIRNVVHVRVQRDDADGGWADVASATGAVADDLVSLEVEDLTGDGRPEIHTRQWVGVNGESISLWSFANDRLGPMRANGGCWNGTNTFGLVGARVDFGQVRAICEDDPLPPYLWSTAVYRWVDGAWTYRQRVGVFG